MVMAIIMVVVVFLAVAGVLTWLIWHIVTKTPIDNEGCGLSPLTKKKLLKQYHKLKRKEERKKAKESKSTI